MIYFKGEAGPEKDDECFDPDVLASTSGDPFKVGSSWGGEPATQQACSVCGGKEFHIATGQVFTAVRCVTCRWELCIHEG